MQPIKITIENYLNIPLRHPIQIEIRDGVSFILGMNNVGKSTILKFFFEMRNVLELTGRNMNSHNNRQDTLNGDVYFDQIVNRKFPDYPVHFKLESGGYSLVVEVIPNGGEKHTKNLFVSQTYIPLPGSCDPDKFTLWNSWSTGGTVVQNQKTDELVEELKELLGFKKFVIRVSEDRKTLKITTDDGTFSLDEIGSGIS
jgi:hypothetical protein